MKRGESLIKVLAAVQLPPPLHGAAAMNERAISALGKCEEFELRVINLARASEYGSLRKITPRKLITSLFIVMETVLRLLFQRPKVLYISLAPKGPAFYRDAVIALAARTFRIPRVIHLHGKGYKNYVLGSFLRRVLFRGAFDRSLVIVLADCLRAEVESLSSPLRLEVVPNGIEDLAIDGVGKAQQASMTILFLSNLAISKGPLVLLSAVSKVRLRGFDVRVLFAGMMSTEFGFDRFLKEAADRGVGEVVEYLGPVDAAAKAKLFSQADLFVHPTMNDTQPLVLVEAMVFGKVIISTREGAIPQMIQDRVHGLLVEPGDDAQLADAICEILESAEIRRELSEGARARYEEMFEIADFKRRLCDVVRTACRA